MSEIIDFQQAKNEREQPTVEEIIHSFSANNCDGGRPFNGQPQTSEGIRGTQMVNLRMRDIQDCFVLALLTCRPDHKYPEIIISEQGNEFPNIEALIAAKGDYADSVIDCTKVTYNDVYGWSLDDLDPIAVAQNLTCLIERRMGIYPNVERLKAE